MSPEFGFYAAAIPAVLLAGLSKGGFGASLGMLATPVLALAVSPVRAAAVMLPVLLLMDAISLISYRRRVRWSVIRHMIPGAFAGIALGWATAAYVNEHVFRIVVGMIAIGFALHQMAGDWLKRPPSAEAPLRASLWGVFAGYTSFVSHAGGPPFQAYTLPLKLDKLYLAGTSAVFFALVNLVKVAPYFLLGQFDAENLRASAALAPLAIAGVLFGVWLVRRVSQQGFYNVTYAAMILVGSKLVYDGIVALL